MRFTAKSHVFPNLIIAGLLVAIALSLSGCTDTDDHIAELTGSWTGICSFQTGGAGSLELTIESDGDADGYESVYSSLFFGNAAYLGDQFYLYADPIELEGSLINGDLIGTITYRGTDTTDEGTFDLVLNKR